MTDLPPEPLWPDPVLRPPAGLPWEQPWDPTPLPPPPPPREPEPAPPRRTRPARTARAQPTPQHAPPPPTTTWPQSPTAEPPRWGNRPHPRRTIVGLLVGLFFFGVLVTSLRHTPDEPPPGAPPRIVLTTPTPLQRWPAHGSTEASTTVDASATSFDQPVGTAVRFAGDSGEWTVAVLRVEWLEPCEERLGRSPVVVATVRVSSVAGSVQVLPFVHFRFVSEETAVAPTFTNCANPPLGEGGLSAGNDFTGQLAFQVPDGVAGEITYGLAEPSASWAVTARP